MSEYGRPCNAARQSVISCICCNFATEPMCLDVLLQQRCRRWYSSACTLAPLMDPYLTSQNLDDRDLRGFRPRLSIDSRQRARFGSYVSEEPNVTIFSTFQLGKVLVGEPLLTIRPRREYPWRRCASRDRRGSTSSSHSPSSTGMAHHKMSVVRASRGLRSPIWRGNVRIVPAD